MAKDNYVAYVGTYTNGTSKGIHIYDVDVDEGLLYLRRIVPVRNSSYVYESRSGTFLYSVADEGIQVFEIKPDGDLTSINKITINGMRGHHITQDRTGKYLFVAGYHDGKVTMIHTHRDGRLGSQTDEVYHTGIGGIRERSWRPHVCCVRVSPDNRYLFAVDSALDQIVIYEIDHVKSKLKQIDILRMGKEAGPSSIWFSLDGRFAYVLCEITCTVRVYKLGVKSDGFPPFDLIEEHSTLSRPFEIHDTGASLRLSYDGNYLIVSTAGENTVAIFEINHNDGTLKRILALPTSGNYPKDAILFPDQRHLAAVNNGENTITTFTVDYEKGTLVMKGRPHKIDKPNCLAFHKIEKAPASFRSISEDEAEAEAQAIIDEAKKMHKPDETGWAR